MPQDDLFEERKIKNKNPITPPVLSSNQLFWRHIKALEIKRLHHSKRNKKGMLCEVWNILENYWMGPILR